MKLIVGKKNMRGLKKVRHSNELNQTLSSIPISAKRVLFLALSRVNPTTEMDLDETIFITAHDYATVTRTDINHAYRNLKEGADTLRGIGLRLEKEEIQLISEKIGLGGRAPDYMNLNLMEYSLYEQERGRIGVKFTRTASQYISSIIGHERKYTAQALISVVMLSTTHSTTLYQLIRKKIGLSKQRYAHGFEIDLDELRKEMGLIGDDGALLWNEYPIFKRDVLNKAIKEIEAKTEVFDLSFTVSGKVGRKVSRLLFQYTINEEKFTHQLAREGKTTKQLADEEFLESFDKLFPTADDSE